MHHRPVGWVTPIHKAQPDVAANANPASLMANPPDCPPLTRKSNHGPAVKATEVPAAKATMMTNPSKALADRDATNNAEYSKPHGIKAQPTPRTTGAFLPMLAITGFALRQTR